MFTRLGLTSFGGPVAHVGYFREELVARRRWIDDRAYADLVALCQFLPGPASSQIGISLGLLRAGLLGSLLAWIGFTLPSAAAMAAFALGLAALGDTSAGWLHGLKIAAVAVVAQAVWTMARSLCPDRPRATVAVAAAIALLAWPENWLQVGVIVVAGVIGWRLLAGPMDAPGEPIRVPIGRRFALGAWTVFALLLMGLPVLRELSRNEALALFDSFYRVGSLVFGGGHVVLPLLRAEVVPTGWVAPERFVAGYGAAQAVPGPLFTFAAFLGATAAGVGGAVLALVAVFLPSFLLLYGSLPFWALIRSRPGVQGALRGINAAVVGILLAALYDPVWTSAIERPLDFALALAAFALLAIWRAAPWLVVALSAASGALLSAR